MSDLSHINYEELVGMLRKDLMLDARVVVLPGSIGEAFTNHAKAMKAPARQAVINGLGAVR